MGTPTAASTTFYEIAAQVIPVLALAWMFEGDLLPRGVARRYAPPETTLASILVKGVFFSVLVLGEISAFLGIIFRPSSILEAVTAAGLIAGGVLLSLKVIAALSIRALYVFERSSGMTVFGRGLSASAIVKAEVSRLASAHDGKALGRLFMLMYLPMIIGIAVLSIGVALVLTR